MSTTPDVSVSGNGTLVSTGIPTTYPHYTEDEFRVLMEKMEKKKDAAQNVKDVAISINANLVATIDESELPNEDELKEMVVGDEARADKTLREYASAMNTVRVQDYGICHDCHPAHVIPFAEMKASIFRKICMVAENRKNPKGTPHKKVKLRKM